MTKTDIIDHRHVFVIGDMEVELLINYRNGLWSSKKIKGDTGTGDSSGGVYGSLDEYISDREKSHRYSCSFFNSERA